VAEGMCMSTANAPIEEIYRARSKRSKTIRNWVFITIGVMLVIAIILAGLSFYQATRFNSNVTINDVPVGGLTAGKALDKLKGTSLKNRVFVGEELIID